LLKSYKTILSEYMELQQIQMFPYKLYLNYLQRTDKTALVKLCMVTESRRQVFLIWLIVKEHVAMSLILLSL